MPDDYSWVRAGEGVTITVARERFSELNGCTLVLEAMDAYHATWLFTILSPTGGRGSLRLTWAVRVECIPRMTDVALRIASTEENYTVLETLPPHDRYLADDEWAGTHHALSQSHVVIEASEGLFNFIAPFARISWDDEGDRLREELLMSGPLWSGGPSLKEV